MICSVNNLLRSKENDYFWTWFKPKNPI